MVVQAPTRPRTRGEVSRRLGLLVGGLAALQFVLALLETMVGPNLMRWLWTAASVAAVLAGIRIETVKGRRQPIGE